jgi:signal peptidase I
MEAKMEMKTQNKGRNKTAAILGLALPGLGQVYNGELLKGVCFILIYAGVFITGMKVSVLLPDKGLLAGVVLTLFAVLFIYGFSIIDAFRHSAGLKYQKAYTHWYFYIAAWIVGSVLFLGSVYSYARNNVFAVYKIASESMEPQTLKGDRVVVDKTAYNRISPNKGDIVVFIYPDDRSKVYIKRIAALPGETIKLADGSIYMVPHGEVYVLGDNAGTSSDSRNFGPVPLADVLGKARLVCWSHGPEGVRWERIGMTLSRANLDKPRNSG